MEKTTTLQISTTYENLGELTEKTENIWLVCHGYGQLAKYFIRRFDILDLEKNYVIAPQGLSKFYIDGNYGKVGASWLTKENREMDLQNALTYLRFIYENEVAELLQTPLQIALQNNKNNYNKLKINLLGFSQGAAMISRWAVACQIPFDKLVIWGGRFPDEIQKEQLNFVKPSAEIILVIGDKDEFYQQTYIDEETTKLTKLIKTPQLIIFDGTHEVRRDVLQQLI